MASEWVTSVVSTTTLIIGAGISYLTQAGSDRRKLKAEVAARKEEADRAERIEREKLLAERQRFRRKSVLRLQRAASVFINETSLCEAYGGEAPVQAIARQAKAASEFAGALSLVVGDDMLNEFLTEVDTLDGWARGEPDGAGLGFDQCRERFHAHVASVSREILGIGRSGDTPDPGTA